MAFVEAPGLASSNTYINEADADAFFLGVFNSASWDVLTTGSGNEKEAVLRQATRWIDANVTWAGKRKFPLVPQALDFPRTDLEDCDTGEDIVDTTIPVQIEEATCVLAQAIADATPSAIGDDGDASKVLKKLKAGSVELTFNDYVARGSLDGYESLPVAVKALIPDCWVTNKAEDLADATFVFCASTPRT